MNEERLIRVAPLIVPALAVGMLFGAYLILAAVV